MMPFRKRMVDAMITPGFTLRAQENFVQSNASGNTDVARQAVDISLAAFGVLNPVMAGAAMAMSSVSVMSNALLLKRWVPKL